MKSDFHIENLDRMLKNILLGFVMLISIGYGFGLRYMYLTTGTSTQTLEENYLGNETDEEAGILKFKKSEKTILTFLHNHLFTLAIIQLLISLLLYFTRINKRLKQFLVIEPFITLPITFLSIYGLWSGIVWIKYILPFSGFLFHLTFIVSLLVLMVKLIFSKPLKLNEQ